MLVVLFPFATIQVRRLKAEEVDTPRSPGDVAAGQHDLTPTLQRIACHVSVPKSEKKTAFIPR